MTREELKSNLESMGVPEYFFNLDGTGSTDETMCLTHIGTEWQVYYKQNGIKTTNERFATEEEACDFIFAEFCK